MRKTLGLINRISCDTSRKLGTSGDSLLENFSGETQARGTTLQGPRAHVKHSQSACTNVEVAKLFVSYFTCMY